jgi:hypothetical protein
VESVVSAEIGPVAASDGNGETNELKLAGKI